MHRSIPVVCTDAEYDQTVRVALLWWADICLRRHRDPITATECMDEVERLDGLHGYARAA